MAFLELYFPPIFLVGFAFLSAWLAAYGVAVSAKRLGLIDSPGHRASHSTPTPTGGGIGIALGASIVMAWLGITSGTEGFLLIAAACLGLGLALVGWLDDRKGVSPGVRLLIQSGVVLTLLVIQPLAPLELPFGINLSGDWLMLAGVLAALWWINMFNFMDGIDGLAATQAIFMLGAASLLAWWGQPAVANDETWIAMLATAAAALGFLTLNWPPARVFMGDVGSLFLGFVMAFFALQTISSGCLGYPAWMILGTLFIVDATVTLLTRLARGERPHEAHRSHVYQRLARRWGAHRPVTLLYFGLNVFWIFPLAACTLRWSQYSGMFVALAYLPLLAASWKLGAGRAEHA